MQLFSSFSIEGKHCRKWIERRLLETEPSSFNLYSKQCTMTGLLFFHSILPLFVYNATVGLKRLWIYEYTSLFGLSRQAIFFNLLRPWLPSAVEKSNVDSSWTGGFHANIEASRVFALSHLSGSMQTLKSLVFLRYVMKLSKKIVFV